MNSTGNTKLRTGQCAQASALEVTNPLASNPDAIPDLSQPAHETCALRRHRGVEVILAKHHVRPALAPAKPGAADEEEVQCRPWELALLIGLVVLSYASLAFCAYVIVAKCRGKWPP